MTKRAKIVKQGNTLSITITKEAKAMGLGIGDYVDVILERPED